MNPSTLCLALLLSLSAPVLSAAEFSVRSGPRQAALLELFSSEGCSSCPPAEAWLAGLETNPQLWKGLVPVAFHVDYWDRLGWRDRLADGAFTARQHAYAAKWQSRSVYTPGFVWNGREWKGWFSGGRLPEPSATATGELVATTAGERRWSVTWQPAPGTAAAGEVTVALLGCDLASDVRAGENRGRRLQHSFVVLALASAPARAQAGRFGADVALPAPRVEAGRQAVAAWVTASDGFTVLQAAGGWLARPAPATEVPKP